MLFWGSFVSPVKEMSVEPVVAPIEVVSSAHAMEDMTAETEKILIEDYAAPHWGLSVETAWAKYYEREIVLEEIVPDLEYKIHYGGHVLDISLEDHV